MTIASALDALNTDIQNARTAITNKGGTVTANGGSSQLATDIATIPSGGSAPVITSLNVTPTTSTQTITAPSGTDGYSPVNVSAVTSSIDSNIVPSKIKNGVTILGVTGTYSGTTPTLITKSITANGTYNASSDNADGYSSVTVNVSGGGGTCNSTHVNCCVNQYGVSSMVELIKAGSIPYNNLALKPFATRTNNGSTGIMYVNYNDGTESTSSIGRVEKIGPSTMKQLILPNLTYANYQLACENFTSLEKVDLSNLEEGYLSRMFKGCSALSEIILSKLSNIAYSYALGGTNAQGGTFSGCTSLATLSFPSLTSTSFGSYTNQFNMMLKGVTGCTVHFPSNLQSVIGSWSSVTSGFGGTNTIVLFDLPATS